MPGILASSLRSSITPGITRATAARNSASSMPGSYSRSSPLVGPSGVGPALRVAPVHQSRTPLAPPPIPAPLAHAGGAAAEGAARPGPRVLGTGEVAPVLLGGLLHIGAARGVPVVLAPGIVAGQDPLVGPTVPPVPKVGRASHWQRVGQA